MASRGPLRPRAGSTRSEGCSRELCEAKSAWRRSISMRVSSRRSSGLLTHYCTFIAASAAEPVASAQPVSVGPS
eukprot:2499751-Prymnesium_polylepis.1